MITDDSLDFCKCVVFLGEWWVAAKLLPTLHVTHATLAFLLFVGSPAICSGDCFKLQ